MAAPAEPWIRMQSALSAFMGAEITTRGLLAAAGLDEAHRLLVVAGLVLRANGWTAKRKATGDRPRVYSRPAPAEVSAA